MSIVYQLLIFVHRACYTWYQVNKYDRYIQPTWTLSKVKCENHALRYFKLLRGGREEVQYTTKEAEIVVVSRRRAYTDLDLMQKQSRSFHTFESDVKSELWRRLLIDISSYSLDFVEFIKVSSPSQVHTIQAQIRICKARR